MGTDTELLQDDTRIAEALRFVGVHVNSVYELVNTERPYPEAIPTLVRLFTEVRHPRVKEGIARALSVKEAAGVVPELIRLFKLMKAKTYDEESAKWALGNAIAVAATDKHVPDVIGLIRDRTHGLSRYMLPLALAKARASRDEAVEVLIEALTDDQLACKACEALVKLRATRAVTSLRRLLKHENKDIRRAAEKALVRLEKE